MWLQSWGFIPGPGLDQEGKAPPGVRRARATMRELAGLQGHLGGLNNDFFSTLETLHLSGPFIQEGSVPSHVTEWLGVGVGVGEEEHQAGSQEFQTLLSV